MTRRPKRLEIEENRFLRRRGNLRVRRRRWTRRSLPALVLLFLLAGTAASSPRRGRCWPIPNGSGCGR